MPEDSNDFCGVAGTGGQLVELTMFRLWYFIANYGQG
jgi:hypothetical protein